jgi:hypothetical protein
VMDERLRPSVDAGEVAAHPIGLGRTTDA